MRHLLSALTVIYVANDI